MTQPCLPTCRRWSSQLASLDFLAQPRAQTRLDTEHRSGEVPLATSGADALPPERQATVGFHYSQ